MTGWCGLERSPCWLGLKSVGCEDGTGSFPMCMCMCVCVHVFIYIYINIYVYREGFHKWGDPKVESK